MKPLVLQFTTTHVNVGMVDLVEIGYFFVIEIMYRL